jgi:magnesium chelatase subunit I
VRASCVEFVLAGLWATDRISRSEKHGRVSFEVK